MLLATLIGDLFGYGFKETHNLRRAPRLCYNAADTLTAAAARVVPNRGGKVQRILRGTRTVDEWD